MKERKECLDFLSRHTGFAMELYLYQAKQTHRLHIVQLAKPKHTDKKVSKVALFQLQRLTHDQRGDLHELQVIGLHFLRLLLHSWKR